MIFTSNFKTAGHLPQAIAICRSVPRGWTGRRYIALAPSWKLLKAKLLEEEFIKAYRAEVLDKLDPVKVIQDLGGDDFILLCWEAPGEFCHRRVVARWLEEAMGIEVPELIPTFDLF
jgi:hypothetical protein